MLLKIHLFGSAQARYSNHPLNGFPARQPLQLFCYLLLNRQRHHHRERLANLFWEDYPTATSLKYLRDSIWRMRQALQAAGAPPNDYLAVDNHSISFNCNSRYWLDIEAFEAQALRYQDIPAHRLSLEQAADLEETLQLYTGDLLESVYEDWCLYDRERFRLLHLGLLNKLANFYEHNGNYQHSLICCRRILAHNDAREKTHRQMMRLYWLVGDRESALKQYERCAQILRESLDVPPMIETQHIYQQIKQNQYPAIPRVGNNENLHTSPPPASDSPQASLSDVLQEVHQLQALVEHISAALSIMECQINELANSRITE